MVNDIDAVIGTLYALAVALILLVLVGDWKRRVRVRDELRARQEAP